MKWKLSVFSTLFILGGLFYVSQNSSAIGASLYCKEGKDCSSSFNFEGSDQSKYKSAESNKYCNGGQCITKWLKQGDLPPGKNGFCLLGICLKNFNYLGQPPLAPGLNFTINDQKGVVWIPVESDIHLKWNISPPAQEVSLSCSGDCPDLNDINNQIKTAYTRRGAVDVNWNTAESTWTLYATRDSARISETITVVPVYNEYSDWFNVDNPTGWKYQRGDGLTEYSISYMDPTWGVEQDWSDCPGHCSIVRGVNQGASMFNFMNKSDYDEALNNVLNGPGILASFKDKIGLKISTQREFEHYFGLAPCIDKELDIGKTGSTTFLFFAKLTPAYQCSSTPRQCMDYAPICEGDDLQKTWAGTPPIIPCILNGVKARVANCIGGKSDGDIRWAESGNYSTKQGLATLATIVTSKLLEALLSSLSRISFPEDSPNPPDVMKTPSPREVPLKCPPGKCEFIQPLKVPNKPSGSLIVGAGQEGGPSDPVNKFLIDDAIKGAQASGVTSLGIGINSSVVSNAGNIPLRFAQAAVKACGTDQRCLEFARSNAPRYFYETLKITPLKLY